MASLLTASVAIAACLAGAPAHAAQGSVQPPPVTSSSQSPPPDPQAPPTPPTTSSAATSVDVTRIRKALDANVAAPLGEAKPRYQLVIVAPFPTFAERFGKTDLRFGPVAGTAMTHAEFVRMVTPQILNSSAGITAMETLQGSVVNWVAKSAVKKALEAYTNSRSRAELGRIRAQIDRELAALRGGG